MFALKIFGRPLVRLDGEYVNKYPNRQSHRWKGFNYSRNGTYFITIVCQDRVERFGEIINHEMVLNDAGKMVQFVWNHLSERYPTMKLGTYVVMPNHFHGIMVLDSSNVGAYPCGRPDETDTFDRADTRPAPTIGDIVGGFKSITTHRYCNGVKMNLVPPFRKRLWQRDFHDHVIRDEKEYRAIEWYIDQNPQTWTNDRFYSNNSLHEDHLFYGTGWDNFT